MKLSVRLTSLKEQSICNVFPISLSFLCPLESIVSASKVRVLKTCIKKDTGRQKTNARTQNSRYEKAKEQKSTNRSVRCIRDIREFPVNLLLQSEQDRMGTAVRVSAI